MRAYGTGPVMKILPTASRRRLSAGERKLGPTSATDPAWFLARNHAGSVALVGPNFLSPADNRRLLAVGNIFMTGPVPYARIPDYMSAFDVCITPHKISQFTESLNPIKLWEYLAAGLPIVSTDIA